MSHTASRPTARPQHDVRRPPLRDYQLRRLPDPAPGAAAAPFDRVPPSGEEDDRCKPSWGQAGWRPPPPVIWLWGLSVSLLLVTVLGGVLAMRHQPQREQRGAAALLTGDNVLPSSTSWRQEIKRLSEENQRLWEERVELVTVCPRRRTPEDLGDVTGHEVP